MNDKSLFLKPGHFFNGDFALQGRAFALTCFRVCQRDRTAGVSILGTLRRRVMFEYSFVNIQRNTGLKGPVIALQYIETIGQCDFHKKSIAYCPNNLDGEDTLPLLVNNAQSVTLPLGYPPFDIERDKSVFSEYA